MPPKRQRTLKFVKENGQLSFISAIYTYMVRQNLDGSTTNVVKSKVESAPHELQEDAFVQKVENVLDNGSILPHGTVWSSVDRKIVFVQEPPGIKSIYVSLYDQTFLFPHPSVLYCIMPSATNVPYVKGIWFFRGSDINPLSTELKPAWLLNVFKTGFVCTHNIYQDNEPNNLPYSVMINTAISDFWNGTFNDEVQDFTKTDLTGQNIYYEDTNILSYLDDDNCYLAKSDRLFKYLIGLDTLVKLANYDINNKWISAALKYAQDYYYNSGSFKAVIKSVMKDSPHAELMGDVDLNYAQNLFLMNDILRIVYS